MFQFWCHHRPSAGLRLKAVHWQRQPSANKHQPVSKCIKLSVSSKCQKVTFSSNSSKEWLFGCLWRRSKIRAHSKLSDTEHLLGLFQYNVPFALFQSSSSNWYYKLKSMKVPADLLLDNTRFFVKAFLKQDDEVMREKNICPTFCNCADLAFQAQYWTERHLPWSIGH